MKKTRAIKIQEAVDFLNKAMALEEPDIRISLHGGFEENKESKEFMEAFATFIKVYKKFFELAEAFQSSKRLMHGGS